MFLNLTLDKFEQNSRKELATIMKNKQKSLQDVVLKEKEITKWTDKRDQLDGGTKPEKSFEEIRNSI